MWKAYKGTFGMKDLYTLPLRDQVNVNVIKCYINLILKFKFQAKFNAERLQRIWEDEQSQAEETGRKPSFPKAVLIFAKTRVILASAFMMLSIVFQFLGPVSQTYCT